MADYESQEFDEMTQHISFIRNEELSGSFPWSSIIKMKNQMQSLLLLPMGQSFDMKLAQKELSGFKRLKVLGLRKAGLEEVPRTIGELQLLRYLDLSGNSEIKKLPRSITMLVNLVYLNLNGCKNLEQLPVDLNKLQKLIHLSLFECRNLRKLPRGITKLVKLRELYLEGCLKLRHMPLGMRNMTSLQRLDLFVDANESDFHDDADEVGGLAELNCLNNLEGDLRIHVHGSSSDAKATNLLGKKKLTELVIEFRGVRSRERDEMMLEGFQPHTNLRRLLISGYGGGRLPSWIEDCCNLEEIWISDWEEGHICVDSFGRLPNLKRLTIERCENIESSGSNSANAFPKLKELFLRNISGGCPELTTLPNQEAELSSLELLGIENCPNLEGIPCFPKLKHLCLWRLGLEFVPNFFKVISSIQALYIQDCEELKELPEWIDTFTSLEEIDILDCPNLTTLPKQTANLKIIFGTQMADPEDFTLWTTVPKRWYTFFDQGCSRVIRSVW